MQSTPLALFVSVPYSVPIMLLVQRCSLGFLVNTWCRSWQLAMDSHFQTHRNLTRYATICFSGDECHQFVFSGHYVWWPCSFLAHILQWYDAEHRTYSHGMLCCVFFFHMEKRKGREVVASTIVSQNFLFPLRRKLLQNSLSKTRRAFVQNQTFGVL